MPNKLTLKDLIPTIKEVVSGGQEATFIPHGISMKPMLTGGRDEIILVKPEFPLKKYDLPLYVRANGMVVLHRIVDIKDNNGRLEYIMCGDNTWSLEHGIFEENIVAVVSRFRRNGKWYEATNKGYKAYAKLWSITFPLRKGIRWVVRLPFRAVRKLKRMLFSK